MTHLVDWTLFDAYCFGMAVSGILSLPYRPAFALRIFYAAVIISAHFYLVPISHMLGTEFYMYCGLAQFLILLAALFVACSATIPIAILAFIACIINTFSYYNYPSHEGVWTIYYGAINAIQTAQITCLIFFSPVSIRIIKKYTRVNGAQSWMLRRIFQEI